MELPVVVAAVVVAAMVDSPHPPASCGMWMWRPWKNDIKMYESRVEDIIQPTFKKTQNASTTK